jgi:hypothetical protein
MASILFNTSHGLDDYRNHPTIEGQLGGNYVLKNLSEFLAWYMPEQPRQSLPREASTKNPYGPTSARRLNSISNRQNISDEILLSLAQMVCSDIDDGYGRRGIQNLLTSGNKFDLLVALRYNYESLAVNRTTVTVSNNKLATVVAFIIAEVGECRDKPNTVSVNLICKTTQTPPFKAHILLGAYLYCIKHSNYDQEGILELAGGYDNMAGFMSYTKLGFNYDPRLYGDNCFDSFDNLPMSVNLIKMAPETIINLVGDVSNRRIDNIDDPTMLYKLKDYKNTHKRELSILQNISNMYYRLELGGEIMLQHYTDPLQSGQGTSKRPFYYVNNTEKSIIAKYKSEYPNNVSMDSLKTFLMTERDRLVESISTTCKDGICTPAIRCINGICTFLGQPDILGGKHKSKKSKKYTSRSRKYTSRSRKYTSRSRKYTSRKHK